MNKFEFLEEIVKGQLEWVRNWHLDARNSPPLAEDVLRTVLLVVQTCKEYEDE